MASTRRYSLPDVINIAPMNFLQQDFSSLVLDRPSLPTVGEEGMPSVYETWSRRVANSNGSFVSDGLIGTSTKLTGFLEDQITAPSGREVVITSRRVLAGRMGRGGAGNTISTSDESQQAAEHILKQERQVLQHHKQYSVPDYKTGRGGAGAKGHVNVKGKVPNHERAIAKERYVQMKWNAEKEMKGGIRTGRGGRGNIVKAHEIDSTGSVKASTSKSPFGESSLASRRRRHRTSLSNTPSIFSPGPGSIRPSYDGSRPTTAIPYDWDYAETIYDSDTGITTTTVDPSTVLTSASPSAVAFSQSPPPIRLPNEVAPFSEPTVFSPDNAQKSGVRPHEEKLSNLDSTAKRPKSLFRSFKNLSLGKAKEDKHSNHFNVPNVILQHSKQPNMPSSINSSTGTLHQAYRTYITPASAALSMVDPTVRLHAFPPRDVGPTIVSLHEGAKDSRSSSERSEDVGYVRERTDSGTSGFSSRSLPLPSPLAQPPTTFTQVTTPSAKTPETPKRSRPLPIPPVTAHPIFFPSVPRRLPSPPLSRASTRETKPSGLPA